MATIGTATINGQVKRVEVVERMLTTDPVFGDEWVLFTTNLDGTGSFIIGEAEFAPER